MRIFICHSTLDSEFVIQVASLLKPNFEEVFYYETQQRAYEGFNVTIGAAMQRCDYWLVFVGAKFSKWQQGEVGFAAGRPNTNVCTIYIRQPGDGYPAIPNGLEVFADRPRIEADPKDYNEAVKTAWKIMRHFADPAHPLVRFHPLDGLPFDPNLFSYEKDIIAFFTKMIGLKTRVFSPLDAPDLENDLRVFDGVEDVGRDTRQKLLNGCPPEWPRVDHWKNDPDANPKESYVVAAALDKYHKSPDSVCMIKNKLYFPEARTQEEHYFPIQDPVPNNEVFLVGILVAGGIAPGINAVIDGIVQRHWMYSKDRGYVYNTLILGIKNGVSSIRLSGNAGHIRTEALVSLAPNKEAREWVRPDLRERHPWEYTGIHAQEGGSIIGTSRVDDLIKNKALLAKVADAFLEQEIKILYIIGGDGSMKLAHALWNYANTNRDTMTFEERLSVVAIPKTMDNDILWMWQSFGFLSAVEKAREILTILDTEIKSNPRLCILQLFGSDSGFVVSHTVAASGSDQCDAALIPEVKFSLRGLAHYLKKQMCERTRTDSSAIVPSGFVVMSETAIPTDAICYVDDEGHIPQDLLLDWNFIRARIGLDNECLTAISREINLSTEEKKAIYEFHRMRRKGERIQGQTSDTLRSAGLKIVSRGLQKLVILPDPILANGPQPDWGKLRIVTNEPRHVLRSIAPTCSDIIMGQRLGTLAVDNALAGYTDFMISQWLTEFVLVPLPLVVLGRKRIPMQGMFWKSVLAKTGQPSDLDTVGDLPTQTEP